MCKALFFFFCVWKSHWTTKPTTKQWACFWSNHPNKSSVFNLSSGRIILLCFIQARFFCVLWAAGKWIFDLNGDFWLTETGSPWGFACIQLNPHCSWSKKKNKTKKNFPAAPAEKLLPLDGKNGCYLGVFHFCLSQHCNVRQVSAVFDHKSFSFLHSVLGCATCLQQIPFFFFFF